ncbi:MAG: glycosyltransferase family 2 protein [Acidimicrobiia bacterium]
MERLPSLSCFFPAYNEEPNIARLLDEVVATLPQFADHWEAVIVDDGSTDRTASIVRDYAALHPEIRLVVHKNNLGYGHALQTGLKESTGEAVFFTDADLQFHLSDIGALLPAFEDADVVIGYRIKRRDPWHRLVVAGVYHTVLRTMFDLHVRDIDCAFKLFDRQVVDALVGELESRSAFISPELVIRAQIAGFRITEVGVTHYPRTAGKSGGASLKVISRTIREMRRLRADLKANKTD